MFIANFEEEEVKSYKSVFAGEVNVVPRMFNPTKEQLNKLTGQPLETISDSQVSYKKVNDEGKTTNQIVLYCSFNPNKELGVTNYKEECFVQLQFDIDDEEFVIDSARTKGMLIDDNRNTMWCVANPFSDNPIAEFEKLKAKGDVKYSDKWDAGTVRWAKVGEFSLLSLLATMMHRSAGFKFGKDTNDSIAKFKQYASGNVTMLNKYVTTNEYPYFKDSKTKAQKEIGVFLFGKIDKKGILRQNVYTNRYSAFTYVRNAMPTSYKNKEGKVILQNSVAYGESFMPYDIHKGAFNSVGANEKYNVKGFGNNFKFKEITLADFPDASDVSTHIATPTSPAKPIDTSNMNLPF